MGRKRIPTSPASPFYGYPAEVIADVCGISIGSAAHFKAGRRKPPTPVLRLFMLHAQQKILGHEFKDYRVVKGKLWGPDGRPISPSDLGHFSLVFQRLAETNQEAYFELLEKVANEA